MASEHRSRGESNSRVRVSVDPGICGFPCVVEAERVRKRVARVTINHSACEQIKKLADLLEEIPLKDMFAPFSRNPIFMAAEQAGCHPACPVPLAVLKALEVAMDMALPGEVCIRFD